MVWFVKDSLKRVPFVLSVYRSVLRLNKALKVKLLLIVSRFHHKKELRRIAQKTKKGEKVRVAFLVMDIGVWKADSVYTAMLDSSIFSPCIVVIPRINDPDPIRNANETRDYFLGLGYETIVPYNQGWRELESFINPDIIFISNPHDITDKNYYIRSMYKKLTCYIPYFEQVCKDYEGHFNNLTVNLCWKVFQINEIHKEIAKEYCFNKGINIDVVGYPAVESLYNESTELLNDWKKNNLKKIIIAPHHSIGGSTMLANSNFLIFADAYKNLALKYKEEVNFAFKPHPLLKQNLYNHADWGTEKTDKYWSFWESCENTQLETGSYQGLFKYSDAMIHDCSSFLIEYLYVNKPVLYMNKNIRDKLNAYGKFGYDNVLKCSNEGELSDFIEKVVCGQVTVNDKSVSTKLIPKVSPSKAIIERLIDAITP